jgi:hypothetical protein
MGKMPKTTVDLPSEVLAQLEKLQKEKGFEYLKDAYLYALKHGLDIMEKNVEKGIEQSIQIREPITEPSENQIPPCPYASLVVKQTKNGLEYLSYCDNPQKTNLPKDRLLPTLACQKCYQRERIIMPNVREFFLINAYCGDVADASDPEQIKAIPCIRNNGCPYKSENKKECPLYSEQNRKLIIQYLL